MTKNKGITLVALVITVIVLLILAGTAISIAVDSESIFGKAKQASEEWNAAVKSEETTILDLMEIADDATNPDKQAMKLLVNSGSNGGISLPISVGTSCHIDWGDGTVSTGKNDDTIQSSYKVASIDGQKIAVANQYIHNYDTNNKEYVITITGISSWPCGINILNYTSDKILEVLQWGQMELQNADFSYCNNLNSIALPTSNSFKNNEDLYIRFSGCSSLTSIPANLFKYCTNIKKMEWTFSGCSSLTSIPENLFENCTNIDSFLATFCDCTNLTGQAIPLWERMENGAIYNYEARYDDNGTIVRGPDGLGCYYGCTGLTDYSSIPAYWIQNPHK